VESTELSPQRHGGTENSEQGRNGRQRISHYRAHGISEIKLETSGSLLISCEDPGSMARDIGDEARSSN
jgi:hypothetical protein